MNTQKKCVNCLNVKLISEFTVAKSNKDGFCSTCKNCKALYKKQHGRTINGRLTDTINGQKVASKQRGHVPPNYTKAELKEFSLENGLQELMSNWEKSNYDKNLTPSIDRLDDSRGYSLDNIQLVTWKINNDKAYTDRKSCKKITKQNKKINQYTLSGVFLASFDSISLASRLTSVCRSNINATCSGKHKNAGGFIWQYATA